MNWLDANFLFASLFWGSVGVGYWIYGRRQTLWSPMIGGVAMIAISCFVSSWLLMSLLCTGLMVSVYLVLKRGF